MHTRFTIKVYALIWCRYSPSLVAPYRVRALLKEHKVKLIFTYREPLDSHFSYFRQYHDKADWTIQKFLEFSRKGLHLYEDYSDCVAALAKDTLGVPQADGFITDRPPLWVGVQQFEELAHVKCFMPIQWKSEWDRIAFEGIFMYIYAHSIPRWMRVLPRADFRCIEHQHFNDQPVQSLQALLEWFGLADEMPSKEQLSFVWKVPPHTLESFLRSSNEAEQSAARGHLAKLQKVFEHQFTYAKQICGD